MWPEGAQMRDHDDHDYHVDDHHDNNADDDDDDHDNNADDDPYQRLLLVAGQPKTRRGW